MGLIAEFLTGFNSLWKKIISLFWSDLIQRCCKNLNGGGKKPSVLIWSQSVYYLTLTDCASCPGRVYKHQKRTAACVIHAGHWFAMSLNKHAKQRAVGLRGKMIFHWQLAQISASVDGRLRDVLAPLIHQQSKRSAALSRPVCIVWIPAVQHARCLHLQLKEKFLRLI